MRVKIIKFLKRLLLILIGAVLALSVISFMLGREIEETEEGLHNFHVNYHSGKDNSLDSIRGSIRSQKSMQFSIMSLFVTGIKFNELEDEAKDSEKLSDDYLYTDMFYNIILSTLRQMRYDCESLLRLFAYLLVTDLSILILMHFKHIERLIRKKLISDETPSE